MASPGAATPSSIIERTSGGCWWSSPCARSGARSDARRRRSAAAAGSSASRTWSAADAAEIDGLDRIAGEGPSPALVAMVVDEYRRLRDGLRNDSLRQVLDLRLEGYTREEIAERLGCSERTVKRKLELIREAWLEEES